MGSNHGTLELSLIQPIKDVNLSGWSFVMSIWGDEKKTMERLGTVSWNPLDLGKKTYEKMTVCCHLLIVVAIPQDHYPQMLTGTQPGLNSIFSVFQIHDATIIQVAMTPQWWVPCRTWPDKMILKGGGDRIRIRWNSSIFDRKSHFRGEGVRSNPRDIQGWKRCYLYILYYSKPF